MLSLSPQNLQQPRVTVRAAQVAPPVAVLKTPSQSPESFASASRDEQAPSYSRIARDTVVALGQVAGALGAAAACWAGVVFSSAYTLEGFMSGSLATAGAGVLGVAASVGLAMTLADRIETPKAEKASQPEPAPSAIPGGATEGQAARKEMLARDPDLYDRMALSCYQHSSGVYTWGYQGATLGHLHSKATAASSKAALQALTARKQGEVNLAVAALSAGGALLCAASGAGLPALGLGALGGLLVAGWRGCKETTTTALAVSTAHAETAGRLATLGLAIAASQ